ncbi:MAG: hypothetical protein R3E79_34410 [Caldilineaceae bacterium]
MLRSESLTFERLLDWLEGRLSSAESQAIADQVAAADETVQADVAWLRTFLHLSDAIVWEAPPSTVHAALVQQFVDQRKGEQLAGGLWQRLVAALTFDSYLQPGLAGARGVEQPHTRQLIYNSAVADIALNLSQGVDHTLTILGQILPIGTITPESCAVQVLQGERAVGLVLADDLGEFAFTGLPTGEYQLMVTGDQFDLTIPQLSLEP